MADLVERWPQAVGPAIARNAWPARIARDGTLHVNTADSVWAFELGQRAGEIAVKLPDEEPVTSPVEVSPEDAERARAIATGIEDEKLRESVQKAVSLSLARGRSDRPI
jgi:hypothetical protein